MQDIGLVLSNIMHTKKCSPIYAFFLWKEGERGGVRQLQSESEKKISRRLCDKSDLKISK